MRTLSFYFFEERILTKTTIETSCYASVFIFTLMKIYEPRYIHVHRHMQVKVQRCFSQGARAEHDERGTKQPDGMDTT